MLTRQHFFKQSGGSLLRGPTAHVLHIQAARLDRDNSGRVRQLTLGWGYRVPNQLVQKHVFGRANPGLPPGHNFHATPPAEHALVEWITASDPEIGLQACTKVD